MKIICLEEHFATPEIIAAWQDLDPATRDFAIDKSSGKDTQRRLRDLADLRIAAMDEAGIDVSILSQTAPGVQSLAPEKAAPLARQANDRLAEAVRARPSRFQGFATLPTSAPAEAAQELERAVRELGLDGAMMFGRTGDRNLDHPDFWPILERAAKLRAPQNLTGERAVAASRPGRSLCSNATQANLRDTDGPAANCRSIETVARHFCPERAESEAACAESGRPS